MANNRHHLSNKGKQRVIYLYKQGMLISDISKRVEVSESTVLSITRAAGLKRYGSNKFDAKLLYTCPCCSSKVNQSDHICEHCCTAFYRPELTVKYRR